MKALKIVLLLLAMVGFSLLSGCAAWFPPAVLIGALGASACGVAAAFVIYFK